MRHEIRKYGRKPPQFRRVRVWKFTILIAILSIILASIPWLVGMVVQNGRIKSLEEELQNVKFEEEVISEREAVSKSIIQIQLLQEQIEEMSEKVENSKQDTISLLEELKGFKEVENEIFMRTVYAEAADQPIEGQLAVAATILNRVAANSTEFGGDSILEVIFHPQAFSPVTDGTIFRIEMSEEERENIQWILDRALSGEDPTEEKLGGNGALFFYNPNLVSEKRMAERKNIEKTMQYGDHIFFRKWNP